jgi:hypothetical protein
VLKDTKCVVSVVREWLKAYFLSCNPLSTTIGCSQDMILERVVVFPVRVGLRLDFVLMVGVWSSVGCEGVLASCCKDDTRVELCDSVTIFGGLDSVTRSGLEGSVTGFVVVVMASGLVITVLSFCLSSCVCVGIVMTWVPVGLLTFRNRL